MGPDRRPTAVGIVMSVASHLLGGETRALGAGPRTYDEPILTHEAEAIGSEGRSQPGTLRQRLPERVGGSGRAERSLGVAMMPDRPDWRLSHLPECRQKEPARLVSERQAEHAVASKTGATSGDGLSPTPTAADLIPTVAWSRRVR
jgi:hypothetical protein